MNKKSLIFSSLSNTFILTKEKSVILTKSNTLNMKILREKLKILIHLVFNANYNDGLLEKMFSFVFMKIIF